MTSCVSVPKAPVVALKYDGGRICMDLGDWQATQVYIEELRAGLNRCQ